MVADVAANRRVGLAHKLSYADEHTTHFFVSMGKNDCVYSAFKKYSSYLI